MKHPLPDPAPEGEGHSPTLPHQGGGSAKATVSTHVLDVAAGSPATGVRVTLGTLAPQVTNAEGRIADLSGGGIEPGTYQLVFEVDGYYGSRPHLYRKVVLELELAEGRHYHVPLLISPFGLSSYRGS